MKLLSILFIIYCHFPSDVLKSVWALLLNFHANGNSSIAGSYDFSVKFVSFSLLETLFLQDM